MLSSADALQSWASAILRRGFTAVKKMKHILKVYLWLRFALWCGLIFYLSSIPNLKTEFGIWDFILRKIAHMFVYAVLFLFTHSAAAETFKLPAPRLYFYCVVFCIIYAISDEYHQGFVPGRHASPVDVLIDTAGVAAALIFNLKRVDNKTKV